LFDLERLRARLPASPLTRFAPSPTGRLHLGHIGNAIFVWGVARALGGRVLLRIEDHDRERSRLEYERGILDDLAWLGLEPDAHAPRQSERSAAYESALATLHARGLVRPKVVLLQGIRSEGDIALRTKEEIIQAVDDCTLDSTHVDRTGRFTFGNVKPGNQVVYAFHAGNFENLSWIIPVQWDAGTPREVILSSQNSLDLAEAIKQARAPGMQNALSTSIAAGLRSGNR